MTKGMEIGTFLVTLVGTLCWIVCFWWMHRISVRQEAMLQELHHATKRIESLSEQEHALIQEVHPAVERIKEAVESDEAVARHG